MREKRQQLRLSLARKRRISPLTQLLLPIFIRLLAGLFQHVADTNISIEDVATAAAAAAAAAGAAKGKKKVATVLDSTLWADRAMAGKKMG